MGFEKIPKIKRDRQLQWWRAAEMTDKPTLQDVLCQFYSGYLDAHIPNGYQSKAVCHILNCRTGAYGIHIPRSGSCGYIQYHNNSYRDMSCPMCQALSSELWVDAQNEDVLELSEKPEYMEGIQ